MSKAQKHIFQDVNNKRVLYISATAPTGIKTKTLFTGTEEECTKELKKVLEKDLKPTK